MITFEKLIAGIIAPLIILMIIGIIAAPIVGIFPYGPKRDIQIKVKRLYVDYSGSGEHQKSNYMVGTDVGVFEVDNSLWNWIWNADEIYAKLQEGKTYNVTTKGNKVVNMLYQKYPYIIEVKNEQNN